MRFCSYTIFSPRGQQGAVHRAAGEPGEQSPDAGQQRGLHRLPEPGRVHQGGHGSLQKPGEEEFFLFYPTHPTPKKKIKTMNGKVELGPG